MRLARERARPGVWTRAVVVEVGAGDDSSSSLLVVGRVSQKGSWLRKAYDARGGW